MKARYITIIFVALLASSVLWLRWGSTNSAEVVDLEYGNAVHLYTPCEVTEIDIYLDGGSFGGILVDSRGTEIPFCWDGAMRIVDSGGEYKRVPRLAYLGAEHFRDEGAIPIPAGSRGEAKFIEVLRAWIDTEIVKSEQDRMLAAYFDYTAPSEERMNQNELTDVQRRALRTLQVVQALESQRMKLGFDEQSGSGGI